MTYEELKKTLLPDLADYLLGNHLVKFSQSGVLSIDELRILLKDFPSWYLQFCKSEETKQFSDLLISAPSPSNLLESLKAELRIMQARHRNSVYKGADDVIKGFSYDGMVPFISVTNAKKVLFFSKNDKKITDLDYDTYASTTEKEFRIKPMPAVIEFNPYRPEQIYMGDYLNGQKCTHLNTYRKPEWQIGKRLSASEAEKISKLPTIIDDFFSHLFPNPECKEFVYDWLHFSLKERCETYLVMNGAKGVGKNLLSNNICGSLVGKENHKIAHKGALAQFNVILAECRMIVFDEFKMVDDDSINTLKRFANADQMIERKSIDVGKTEKTYNSFIICNNAVTDMKIEWDDRRFSVVDITDKKLEDAWDKERIKMLMEVVDDPMCEDMQHFGYWLLYRKPVVMSDAFSVYKGDHFHKLCYTSFPEWAKMIIDEVTAGNNTKAFFEEGDLRMMLKDRTGGLSRLPNMQKVQDFLKNYKHNGENYLGGIERDERTWYLAVNDAFINKSNDNTGIDWQNVDLL